MERITTFGLVTTLLAMTVCAPARGRDLPDGMTYTTFMRPHKASSSQARAAQFVQTTTDFCLRNADTKIVPDGVVQPDSPGHLALRSRLRFEMEQYKQSLADLEASLQLDPSHAETHRSLSWFLAFCPDRTLRDAKRAVNAAVLSCELTGWEKPSNLAALAAVDSEVGDFDGAAKWQQKAIDALAANDPERQEYHKDLMRYQARKPYHRLGLFEEIRLSIRGRFAKNGEVGLRE